MLENFKKEREKVASEWKEMTASMAQKRNLNKKVKNYGKKSTNPEAKQACYGAS